MNNKGKKTNKSLCEKSVKMAANFVILSSFSIAKMTLRKLPPPPPLLSPTGNYDNQSRSTGTSLRSQEPRKSSRATVYLIEPLDEGNVNTTTSTLVSEEESSSSVDEKALDYIRKVHEKNRNHSANEASHLGEDIVPPPPHLNM